METSSTAREGNHVRCTDPDGRKLRKVYLRWDAQGHHPPPGGRSWAFSGHGEWGHNQPCDHGRNGSTHAMWETLMAPWSPLGKGPATRRSRFGWSYGNIHPQKHRQHHGCLLGYQMYSNMAFATFSHSNLHFNFGDSPNMNQSHGPTKCTPKAEWWVIMDAQKYNLNSIFWHSTSSQWLILPQRPSVQKVQWTIRWRNLPPMEIQDSLGYRRSWVSDLYKEHIAK